MEWIIFVVGVGVGWYLRRKLVDGRLVGPIASKDDQVGKP